MRLLTPQEVSERTQLHPTTIVRACRAGEIEAVKPGGKWRISEEAFEKWLAGTVNLCDTVGQAPQRGKLGSHLRSV